MQQNIRTKLFVLYEVKLNKIFFVRADKISFSTITTNRFFFIKKKGIEYTTDRSLDKFLTMGPVIMVSGRYVFDYMAYKSP